MDKKQLVEIARSFSYKLNVGNYESRDFFCSQKAEVPLGDAEKVSEILYQFCKNEVVKSVNDWRKSMMGPVQVAGTPRVDPNEEWEDLGEGQGRFPKSQMSSRTPEEVQAIIKRAGSVSYRATDKNGGKEKIIKEDLKPY